MSAFSQVRATAGTVPYPPPRLAWPATFILTGALALAFMDRTVLANLAIPISTELHLTDKAFSTLVGLAFAVPFALTILAGGWLSDNFNRRNVLVVAVITWSLAAIGCGLAYDYWSLFSARAVLGVCEAAISPCAISMIADMFPPGPRAKAVSFYNVGSGTGVALSLLLGSFVLYGVARWHVGALPVVGAVAPWHIVFVILGLAGGIIVTLALLTVRDPARHGSESFAKASLGTLLKFMADERKVITHHWLAMLCAGVSVWAMLGWLPTFMGRTYHWSPERVGWIYGTMFLFLTVTGAALSGSVAEWFITKRGLISGTFRTTAIGLGAFTVFGVIATLLKNPTQSLVVVAFTLIFLSVPYGPGIAALTQYIPGRIRGQIIGVYLFVFNLSSLVLGPFIVAFLEEDVFHSKAAIGPSIAVVLAVLGPIGVALLLTGEKALQRSAIALAASEHTPAA